MASEPDPQYWRDRAKEARAQADQTKEDRRSKQRMLGIADFYERLADRIEQHAWKRRRGRHQDSKVTAWRRWALADSLFPTLGIRNNPR